ncbi:hypothetical protein KAR48_05235 [bacterium]|nr:hypothetical protein [bacterium]
MLSMYNMWVVARYEMKTLLRSWFFRIFSGLAIFMLFWLDFAFLTIGEVPWALKALPSTVPYMNLLLLNTVQAVIAVFLASDFLKRDKKLDTTEVIYMRNMSNADYVLGKTVGILLVFMALNLSMLAIAFIFNLISSDVAVAANTYLYYILLISLPTLVFILGLSFLMMIIIGNQAVTFVVLLGYIALTLFYLGRKLHFLFDYMGFYVPLLYSDMAGFGDIMRIIMHRSIYMLAGLAGIGFTVRRLKRLPQSRAVQWTSLIFSFICLAGSIFLGGKYILRIKQDEACIERMLVVASEHANAPSPAIVSMDLDVLHQGRQIDATVKFTIVNKTSVPMDSLTFQLNPGLTISGVKLNGNAATVHRREHLFVLDYQLHPKEQIQIELQYNGGIDERIAHMDAPDALTEKDYRIWLYRIDKRHAFLQNNYALLTPEVAWYPIAGAGYSPTQPWPLKRDFIRFTLNVRPRDGHLAIAQGAATDSAGQFSFIPETPLPSLTLAMGPYRRQSIKVDSVTYSLLSYKKHNYWEAQLDQLSDTLGAVIKELRQDYENQIELEYPFKRLSIVEVPIHFISYPHLWSGHQATVQPEMVLFPENGMGIEWADFKQQKRREKRRSQRRNEVVTPGESQARIFQRFVMNTFVSTQASRSMDEDEEATIAQPYALTPNFFSYVTALKTPQWPLLDAALEAYIGGRVERPVSGFRRAFMGLTDDEKVNQSLRNKSLVEYLANPDDPALASKAVQVKGRMLFALLESSLGEAAFDDLIDKFCKEYRYRPVPVDSIVLALKRDHQFDFSRMLEDWHEGTTLPAYRFAGFHGYLVRDGNVERTQIRFTAENIAAVDGIIKVTVRAGRGRGMRRGGFGGGPDSETESWLFSMPAGSVKEFGLLLDTQPRMLNIETQVAENLPQTISHQFEKFEVNRRAILFEGERLLQSFPNPDPHAIIVDNEDAGFTTTQEDRRSPLKKWLGIKSKAHDKYSGINFWRAPHYWQGITLDEFHGDRIKSAMYTRSGDGSKRAVWTTKLPEHGDYDVWAYFTPVSPPWRRNRTLTGKYHYYIHHEEGVDETLLDIATAEKGWNFLGTFYINSDSARVELSNECEDRKVVADAVKWSRR